MPCTGLSLSKWLFFRVLIVALAWGAGFKPGYAQNQDESVQDQEEPPPFLRPAPPPPKPVQDPNAQPDSAEEEEETETLSRLGLLTSAHVHYGSSINLVSRAQAESSGFGIGVGIRLGYMLNFGLYFGGFFDYFFGEEVGGDSRESFQLAGDIGWDLAPVDIFHIRPYLGLGVHQMTSNFGEEFNSFVMMPGLAIDFDLNRLLFVSAQSHVILPTEAFELNEKSVMFGLGVGIKL